MAAYVSSGSSRESRISSIRSDRFRRSSRHHFRARPESALPQKYRHRILGLGESKEGGRAVPPTPIEENLPALTASDAMGPQAFRVGCPWPPSRRTASAPRMAAPMNVGWPVPSTSPSYVTFPFPAMARSAAWMSWGSQPEPRHTVVGRRSPL